MAQSGAAGTGRRVPGGWRPVVSAALVLAFSALSRTDWAVPGGETLAQRCTFVATLLAIGIRLWLKPFPRA